MSDNEAKGERIAKRIARAGICSRRNAEKWILDGRISVDGQKLTSAAFLVTDKSVITVDGKPLPVTEPTRLWRYHKRSGLVTSHKDEKGRETLFDKLPADMPRVVSVGRLDLASEGLILLTNDGELARKLELPSNAWTRRYRVRVHGSPDPGQIEQLAKGITVEGIKYGPIIATIDRLQGSNSWLTVALNEGKNREIRRVMEHLGLPVNRLIRVAYGPFQLGYLAEGQVEEVPARVLRDQLKAGDAPAVDKGGVARAGLVKRGEKMPPKDDGEMPRKKLVSAAKRAGSTAEKPRKGATGSYAERAARAEAGAKPSSGRPSQTGKRPAPAGKPASAGGRPPAGRPPAGKPRGRG
ncbi:pseudouridine synthase [Lacibacterium aquatile]|uniref:Pseudouridine synthase n=1 Tax=Lacibacterium aquatile TaxID=1168082 RepID=A0ABW5DKU1_9PROT